jgi:hypothetical protein
MSRITKKVAVLVTALTCVLLGSAPHASAATGTVPQTLTQQGRLLDSDGAPVDGVKLIFTFSLYTTAAAGTAIWTENQSITPDNGYFSAKLGDVTAFTPNLFDGSQGTLYLGIKIGSDAEMAPRQELTSVPFAMLALNALSASHAAQADLATKATSATNATNADKATLAATATLATNATSADTVKSIVNNLTLVGAGQSATGQQVLSCPANQLIVGGFCSPSGTGAYVSNSGFYPSSSDATYATKKYTCACAGSTSCAVLGAIVCAK